MAVEIEAKMKVEALDPVRARLEQSGATHEGDHLETNTFFDTEDHSLRAADKGLRLRLTRDLRTGEQQHIITFKGPRQHGPLKSREEVELTVGSASDAVQLIEHLGFIKVLSFEKKRQSWTLLGCKVELDTVPHLGTFVEVEGPGEAAVMKVRETLALSDRAIVKASYVGMLTSYVQERGLAKQDITFADAPVKKR